MRKLGLLLLVLVAACGDSDSHDHDDHAAHVHYSSRGGMLVEVGDHLGSIDLVFDAEAGSLHAYVQDGHATKAVRLTMPAIAIRAKVDGKDMTLVLTAQADELSGETVGDTAHFATTKPSLKGAKTLSGVIDKIKMYGQDFENIEFTYKPDPVD